MKFAFLLAMVACTLPASAAIDLAGKVLQLDSLPKQGVIVSLAGTKLADTTNEAGEWSFVEATTRLVARPATPVSVSSHLVLRNGRLQLSVGGRDLQGRRLEGASKALPEVGPWSARAQVSNGMDTLVYSWNGKTFLRDTLASSALERKGIVRFFDTTLNPAVVHGYVTDGQNNQYRTVAIGSQVWMAQNLRYKVDSSWCYKDSAALCPTYGRLYQWSALFGIPAAFNDSLRGKGDTLLQGVCPQGWHIPTDAEVSTLLKTVDSARSGIVLRSTEGWRTKEGAEIRDGSDSLGFRLPAAGYRNSNGQFANLHTHTAFWTSSETRRENTYRNNSIGSFAWTAHLVGTDTNFVRLDNYKDLGMSVRCIQGAGRPNN